MSGECVFLKLYFYGLTTTFRVKYVPSYFLRANLLKQIALQKYRLSHWVRLSGAEGTSLCTPFASFGFVFSPEKYKYFTLFLCYHWIASNLACLRMIALCSNATLRILVLLLFIVLPNPGGENLH